ncbi:MAG: sodium:calcium antiporter [Candidatus Zixiibacteriota bacterium]
MTHASINRSIDPYLYLVLVLTFLSTVPGMFLGLTDTHVSPVLGSILFGVAIFGAAFILSWAAEAAQIDISESLAVAILALVAVLPEYAVDFVFAWRAAHDPSQAHFAIANMTGANRLLVGLGWPAVLFIYVLAKRKKEIVLDKSQHVEIFYLAMATLYSFTIPLKGSLSLFDTVILVTLFGLYTRRLMQMETTEPELIGPVRIVTALRKTPRKVCTAFFFLYAGIVILYVAEPFADSLIKMGTQLGISQFLLVQWLAPIASEAPEFIVAATWTIRGASGAAMKALISSKVNQWTLLVGTIPLVYAISGSSIQPFVLDDKQIHELVLTAAQSLFAVALLVNLRLNRKAGLLLFVLFAAQLVVEQIRLEVAIIYVLLAIVYHIANRKQLIPAALTGLGIGKNR